MDSTIKAASKRYRFTGKERDEESGLNYHGARYYAPWLCRWVSVDPLEGKYSPWSSYHYGFCNPVTYNDPTGMGSQEQTYTVKKGDNLSTIAKSHNVSVDIVKWNEIKDPNVIQAGAQLTMVDQDKTTENIVIESENVVRKNSDPNNYKKNIQSDLVLDFLSYAADHMYEFPGLSAGDFESRVMPILNYVWLGHMEMATVTRVNEANYNKSIDRAKDKHEQLD